MKQTINNIIKHSTLLFPCAILLIVAVFNSFMYTGLTEDGAHHFFEALTCDNFLLGHEGINIFPYNLRYFPNILSHISVGIAASCFCIFDIKYLVYIFTFVSYLQPIIFLVIIYFNIPKNKKDNYQIILLSFLMCFVFMTYQIWSENLMTGLFLWIIFVIYYYIDFDKLTVFNKFCIAIFSFMLISSHQMVSFFIPILFIIAVKKHINTHKIMISSHIVLGLSYIFFVCALVFNIQYMFSLANVYKDYVTLNSFFNIDFLMFFISIMIVLIISLFKYNKKYNLIKYFVLFVVSVYILYLLLFDIPIQGKFPSRIIGFYIPLFFLMLIICIDFFKITIEYKYIRIINAVLCLLILLNTVHYGLFWKQYLKSINQYIVDNKMITVRLDEQQENSYPILAEINDEQRYYPVKFYTCHPKYILYILIFIEKLFNKYNFKDYVSIKTSQSYLCNDPNHPTTHFIIRKKNVLKKFNIDVDSFVKLNNSRLL